MNRRARARSLLPALVSAVLLAGCSTHVYQDFIYAPHRFQQAIRTQLKIAIIPFEDLRETRASGNLGWASVPIVPYASRSEDRRQLPDERFRSDYYLPDLLAHVIAVELTFNQVSARIDLAPLALDDYDLIIHGTLHSTLRRHVVYSYGLGFLSFFTSLLALPQGSQRAKFDASYVVYDGAGEVLGRQRIKERWEQSYWGPPLPVMHGLFTTAKAANLRFIDWLLPLLERAPLIPASEVRDARIRRYHAFLDPELPELVAERKLVAREHGDLFRAYERGLQAEIERRAGRLELYRRVEAELIAVQQQHVYESEYIRLKQIHVERLKRREIAMRRRRAPSGPEPIVVGSLGAANRTSVIAALAAAREQGPELSHIERTQLAQSLANMPPPPHALADLAPILDSLSPSLEGLEELEGVRALIAGLDPVNLPALREAFLERYRDIARSGSEIEAVVLGKDGDSEGSY